MIQPVSKAFLPCHRYGGWTLTLHKGKCNMFKHAIVLAVAARIILSASPALAQGTGETVRIQDYPATGNMLYRVAIAKGYCEKYGIKCQLQMIPTPRLGLRRFSARA
jgi:hypothetical protein